jgi:hypothetical protein
MNRPLSRCGPSSSVGIATGYGLDGQGIESRWGRDFSRSRRIFHNGKIHSTQYDRTIRTIEQKVHETKRI